MIILHQLWLRLEFIHIVDRVTGGWRAGRNSDGGQLTITVSVLLFWTRSMRGMCHMPVMGHLNPHSIAPLVTVIVVLFASYILTASLSNIVM